ncbi:hypothetical protein FGO68_gene9569 [Halteria grandinella]|uniref:Uncharacterized protein n=1 Tax=Halteria grandinella TaxID=5974 RepID=A0A8J8NAV3_HALGN|nr:hypothetical protein FGO68_gene9569 [Halteria grandinella]
MGVLTKIDIMDQGTNAIKMLKGEEVNLKYGYVGVKLRSQQDIKDNIPITQAVLREKNYFANHPVYSTIPGEIFGTQVLTGKLTRILYRRIRSFLPSLMKEIDQRIGKVQSRLNILGPGLPIEDSVLQFQCRIKCILYGNQYMNLQGDSEIQFQDSTRNRSLENQQWFLLDQKLNYFSKNYMKNLMILNIVHQKNSQMMILCKLYKNIKLNLFLVFYQWMPFMHFQIQNSKNCILLPLKHWIKLIQFQKIMQLKYQKVNQNSKYVQQIRIPSVMKMLEEQIIDVIQSCKRNAHDAVVDVLEAEQNYIFTNDFNYLSGKPFIKFGQEQNSGKVQKGNPMVFELRSKIEHYFKLVVRATRDNIPKLIGYFLVKGCQVLQLIFRLKCQCNYNKIQCKTNLFQMLFKRMFQLLKKEKSQVEKQRHLKMLKKQLKEILSIIILYLAYLSMY